MQEPKENQNFSIESQPKNQKNRDFSQTFKNQAFENQTSKAKNIESM
ncbi:hypothetical protein DCO58_05670 [Helicobacter saguini]|uniref:Uncharacterized protein n=1 Tax=Helicobacter saguini TaxID=1548018 RepID=A0A6B0HKZ0_9HELI|nr:hypothetical protein [Helicobacter saguini]MWV62164.1 hypothetical protein [Helicobacter saguini]MWV67163.1 hypothetical protein [Helicobacter saguini]MWV69515.1 hypothetical protein [Helicobacter saguini]MWV70934.1 hypothetical protein [Helicobacter saguini]